MVWQQERMQCNRHITTGTRSPGRCGRRWSSTGRRSCRLPWCGAAWLLPAVQLEWALQQAVQQELAAQQALAWLWAWELGRAAGWQRLLLRSCCASWTCMSADHMRLSRCGCRRSECVQLTRRDLQQQGRSVATRIMTKPGGIITQVSQKLLRRSSGTASICIRLQHRSARSVSMPRVESWRCIIRRRNAT